TRKEVLVRLMGVQRKELEDPTTNPNPKPIPNPNPPKDEGPKPKGIGAAKGPPSPAAKYFEAKEGFANFYFNKLEQDRLWNAFRKYGDFSAVAGNWTLEGTIRLKKLRTESRAKIDVLEEKDGQSSKPVLRLKIDDFPYVLEPFKKEQE